MAVKTYSLSRDGTTRLSPNFRVQEFRGGVGRYPAKPGRAKGWVHVDTRASKSRWNG